MAGARGNRGIVKELLDPVITGCRHSPAGAGVYCSTGVSPLLQGPAGPSFPTHQDPVLDQEYMVSVPEAPRPLNLFTCISEEIADMQPSRSPIGGNPVPRDDTIDKRSLTAYVRVSVSASPCLPPFPPPPRTYHVRRRHCDSLGHTCWDNPAAVRLGVACVSYYCWSQPMTGDVSSRFLHTSRRVPQPTHLKPQSRRSHVA